MVCKSLRDYGIDATIDVHLMISPVDEIIPAFARQEQIILHFILRQLGMLIEQSNLSEITAVNLG